MIELLPEIAVDFEELRTRGLMAPPIYRRLTDAGRAVALEIFQPDNEGLTDRIIRHLARKHHLAGDDYAAHSETGYRPPNLIPEDEYIADAGLSLWDIKTAPPHLDHFKLNDPELEKRLLGYAEEAALDRVHLLLLVGTYILEKGLHAGLLVENPCGCPKTGTCYLEFVPSMEPVSSGN